ncbi:NIF3 NGG1 interactin-like proteing factor 3-like 1 [Leptodontidium sp. MPI-SDFR-AT-0119]|nr:NIF3 NGG1 interactin-like proteing factor 3-like 1 [Leptodontidium sp. MPI-SDFR-AT-0119]
MNAQRLFRRSLSTFPIMSSPTVTSSPFTKAVVGAMRKLYPEALADKSFDNTGLLLEAPYRPDNTKLSKSALLTIDLTQAVADEAIKGKHSIIISYHPIIFRPLKALTLANTQQNSLLRLASEGISVYSPHTAVDAAPGGLNDWLADIVTGSNPTAKSPYFQPHTRKIINPVPNLQDLPESFSSAGYGRIVTFSNPQSLGSLVHGIINGLSTWRTRNPQPTTSVSVATPQTLDCQQSNIQIKTVGICAGSGGSMLNGLDVDLLFTGELSHHEALAAIEAGRCVVTTFHSNSERAFLNQRMVPALKKMVADELDGDEDFRIDVSECDRDPYQVVLQGTHMW